MRDGYKARLLIICHFDPSTITRFDVIIKTAKETHENEIRAKMKHIMKGKRGELERVADQNILKAYSVT